MRIHPSTLERTSRTENHGESQKKEEEKEKEVITNGKVETPITSTIL